MPILYPSSESSPIFDAASYELVRRQTEALCKPLSTEDYVVQSMPEVSPTKWHLAHTSWFFETFLLKPHKRSYQEFDPHFSYLFNSYYNAIGDRHCRQNRGLLSRPTVREIYAYRAYVDEQMLSLLTSDDIACSRVATSLLEIGLHHEQQHQELILTDIKHVFWVNPMRPAYVERAACEATTGGASRWIAVDGGVRKICHDGIGFAFDNESPRHQEYIAPLEIASRLVTNGEFKQFIRDGGYLKPEYWLSLGWATVQAEQRLLASVRPWSGHICFDEGETIHTENCYKYTLQGFADLAADAGYRRTRVWLDAQNWFSVQFFEGAG